MTFEAFLCRLIQIGCLVLSTLCFRWALVSGFGLEIKSGPALIFGWLFATFFVLLADNLGDTAQRLK